MLLRKRDVLVLMALRLFPEGRVGRLCEVSTLRPLSVGLVDVRDRGEFAADDFWGKQFCPAELWSCHTTQIHKRCLPISLKVWRPSVPGCRGWHRSTRAKTSFLTMWNEYRSGDSTQPWSAPVFMPQVLESLLCCKVKNPKTWRVNDS